MFKNRSNSSQMIGKIDKSLEKKTYFNNKILKIIRGMLLALSILFLCYYGPMQYSILENGQILQGFLPRKTIMTFSLGYSVSHSIIYAIATGMLIYSVILVNNIGPVLFSCTATLVQLVRVKESMFVFFQLIALVQQCS